MDISPPADPVLAGVVMMPIVIAVIDKPLYHTQHSTLVTMKGTRQQVPYIGWEVIDCHLFQNVYQKVYFITNAMNMMGKQFLTSVSHDEILMCEL